MVYPNQCYIELTQKCNLQCLHCFANGSYSNNNEMSFEQVVNIYNQIAEMGIIYVNLSGGEPLLNKDFFKIIEYAANKPFDTCLLTNGTMWDDKTISQMCKADSNRNITIQISLDGDYSIMNKQRNIDKIQYEKIIDNVAKFRSYGFHVVALHVVNALTVLSSLETIKYAISNLQIEALQAVPLFPAGRAVGNLEKLNNFWDEWCRFVINLTDIKKFRLWGNNSDKINIGFFTLFELTEPLDSVDRHDDIFNVWGLDLSSKDNFKRQTRRNFYCEAGQSEIAIDSELNLYPCVASLRTKIKAGKITNKNLIDLWRNDKTLNWFRECSNDIICCEPCNSCTYKEICGGGCRVAALELGNNKFLPDPRCPKVKKYVEGEQQNV